MTDYSGTDGSGKKWMNKNCKRQRVEITSLGRLNQTVLQSFWLNCKFPKFKRTSTGSFRSNQSLCQKLKFFYSLMWVVRLWGLQEGCVKKKTKTQTPAPEKLKQCQLWREWNQPLRCSGQSADQLNRASRADNPCHERINRRAFANRPALLHLCINLQQLSQCLIWSEWA